MRADFVPVAGQGNRIVTYLVRRRLTGSEALGLSADVGRLPIGRMETLVLTLRRVAEIDVSGVAALVRVFSQLRRAGKTLVLTDVDANVKAALEKAGLTGAIPVAEDLPDRPVVLIASGMSSESSAELFMIPD